MVSCTLALIVALAVAADQVPTTNTGQVQTSKNDASGHGPAVERLASAARRYRMQVYNTYRSDRAELVRRRAVWEGIERAWREQGGQQRHIALLLAWLDEATLRSRGDVRGTLPPPPSLEATAKHSRTNTPQQASVLANDHNESRSDRRAIDRTVARPRPAPSPPAPAKAARSVPYSTTRPLGHAPVESMLNVGELLARATGYSVGLRTIDSVLLDPDELNAEQLSTLLDELERLVTQRRDLLLYEGLLNRDHREKLVKPLVFPRTAIAQLGTRIAAVRERNTASDDSDPHREQQLQLLDRLSQRLAKLADR